MNAITKTTSVVAVLVTLGWALGAEPKEYDVKAFGAVGDGKALDGPAIQKTIEAAATAGGGTVVVPAGVYVSGAVRLRSKVTLRLEKDATLQATADAAQFPEVTSRWEGTKAVYPSPLIVAEECRDVAITGAGTVAGNVRAALFKECRNVRVEGVTLTSRLRWTLHLLYCEGVVVENCRFTTSGANTDGVNPDSSRDVLIRKCYFSTGDDCIAIKSGKNAEGVKVGRPSENIRIEDCVMAKGHGGVSIGSEMSGGVRNVTIERCDISGCKSGIQLKTRKGRGGFIENITVKDCRISKVGTALLVDMLYRYTAGTDLIPGEAGLPRLRQLTFSGLTGNGNRTAVSLVGMPESVVDGLTLKNITLSAASAGRIQNATNVTLEEVKVDAPGGILRK